jgi:hypothetical protein
MPLPHRPRHQRRRLRRRLPGAVAGRPAPQGRQLRRRLVGAQHGADRLDDAAPGSGSTPHGALLTSLCTLWAARLGGYLFWRWRKHGADRRYVTMMAHAEQGARLELRQDGADAGVLAAVRAAASSWPCRCSWASRRAPLGPLASPAPPSPWSGSPSRAVGDWQLTRFKADAANAGKVMDTGLWRYTRHPNYFGDACVWWGLYLIAAETGMGAWSLPGPILITVLLTRWSGVPTTEGRMRRQARTTRPMWRGPAASCRGFRSGGEGRRCLLGEYPSCPRLGRQPQYETDNGPRRRSGGHLDAKPTTASFDL